MDIGSQNIRIGASIPGKAIDIKLNDRDQRSTPNYLAFPLNEKLNQLDKVNWMIGADAEKIYMRNTTHGMPNPFSRLWNPSENYFNNLHPSVTAAIALYQHFKTTKLKNDKLTLIVPTYASPQYRQLLFLTAKIAQFKSTSILDSSTAVATYYSVEKIKKGSRKPITVLFIDIGAENADCSFWKYKPLGEKVFMELLQYRHSSKIGGNYVDKLIMEQVEPHLGRPLVGSERYIVNSLMRRAKERIVNQTSFLVDLNEDYGIHYMLNQSDIQNLTTDMTRKLVELLKDISEPDEIELIGGSSRLQVFIDAIISAFPNIPVRRSLNSDEASALGAAYFTALRTGAIIGSKIELKKPSIFGLNATIDDQNVEIFQAGDIIKDRKVYMSGNKTRLIKQYLDLDIYDDYIIDSDNFNKTKTEFNEILIEGIDKSLNQVKDIMLNNTTPTIQLKYGLSPDLDCFDLTAANLIVNVTSNKRSRNRSATRDMKLYFLSLPLDKDFIIPPNVSTFFKSMMKTDEDRLKREENCHKLETFIIETRDAAQYSEEMFAVTTPEEREAIIRSLDEARQTLDCTNLPKDETSDNIDRKLRNLRGSFMDAIERYEDALKRPNALLKLNSAIQRAKEGRKLAICDNETLEEFDKYLNETLTKLENMAKDKPLDKPSFPVNEMKDREKELLKKIPELRRTTKKKDVINFSSNNTEGMDDEEYERLKNAGISVGKPKRKRKKDTDPEIIALKQKQINELEKEQNSTRGAFNQTRKAFYDKRRKFEKDHNLQMSRWSEPNEDAARNRFVEYEEYLNRQKKKEQRKQAKLEAIEQKKREEEARINAEKNKPPTPTPTAEEMKRILKEKEEEEKKKREEEERAQRIQDEANRFKEIGSSIYDYEELNGEDEEALYKKYKELKKKFENERYAPLTDDDKRQEYMEERKTYEDLRRRFENDPERKRKEQEKKRRARQRKAEKEARDKEKTEMDQQIENLQIDQRRLVQDLQQLKEDMMDFDILEKYIVRTEIHEIRKRKRREERKKKKLAKRNRNWEQRSHNFLENSETSTDESDTSFYDFIPDYTELDYNIRNENESSSSESEDKNNQKDKTDSESSLSSTMLEESSGAIDEIRRKDFEISQSRRDQLKLRHLIDPVNIPFEYTAEEIKEMKRDGFIIPTAKQLYKSRFEGSQVDYREQYERRKRQNDKTPPLNPDDNLFEYRDNQDDEMIENMEL